MIFSCLWKKNIVRGSRGNAMIEFALVLPILLLVLFCISELGRMIMVTNALNTASREGARRAAVSGGDDAPVLARVNEVCAAANIVPTNVSVQWNAATQSVQVTVTADFQVLSGSFLPLPMQGVIPLSGTTVFRVEG